MKAHSTSQTRQFHIFSPGSTAKKLTLSIESLDFGVPETAVPIEDLEDIIQLHILCAVSFPEYQQAAARGWLNLNSTMQTIEDQTTFSEHQAIQIEIALAPRLLSQLCDIAETTVEVLTTLQNISQIQLEDSKDIHPLLQEQNWYCTAVKQAPETGDEVVCHTLWHYLLPTLQDPTSDSIANSITHYIQDQTAASLSQITQATDPLFQDISQTFQDLFTETLTEQEDQDLSADSSPLLTVLTDFLEAEDWPYATLSNTEETTQLTNLRLSFRGENGQWSCYASVDEARKTLCFYSIAPVTAEVSQCGAIAHFVTRANYGLILGNFELDYTDGEIRYKTSLDVEGDRLTPALTKNLIYTNVMTMDQYLPGLIAVLENQATPEQAIAQIESSSS